MNSFAIVKRKDWEQIERRWRRCTLIKTDLICGYQHHLRPIFCLCVICVPSSALETFPTVKRKDWEQIERR
jgi:hypothetical protein